MVVSKQLLLCLTFVRVSLFRGTPALSSATAVSQPPEVVRPYGCYARRRRLPPPPRVISGRLRRIQRAGGGGLKYALRETAFLVSAKVGNPLEGLVTVSEGL